MFKRSNRNTERETAVITAYRNDLQLLIQGNQLADALRTVELLNAYGEAKFGDEWWPGNARAYLTDGRGEELERLLEGGS